MPNLRPLGCILLVYLVVVLVLVVTGLKQSQLKLEVGLEFDKTLLEPMYGRSGWGARVAENLQIFLE